MSSLVGGVTGHHRLRTQCGICGKALLAGEHCKIDNAVDRLWITIGKRNLWQRAPMLQLDRETGLDIEIVREKAEAYGIRLLKLLPAELIHMVQEYSDSATFWRYIHVLSIARELSRLQSDAAPPVTSIPLCNILSWTRGDCAAVLSSNCPPVFHVLRLELPASLLGFHIWDTPKPPGIEDCDFYGRVTPSMQFKTTNLRSVTGLTFFFSFSKLYAIHAHTHARPCATKTFDRLPVKRQESVVWIYLPMPRDEEITSIAMRLKVEGGGATTQKPFFMIRTKLAGDVYVGPCHLRQHRDIVLSQSSPELLIHNVADVGPATVFGTYPRKQHRDSLPPFNNRWPNMDPLLHLMFEHMYLSVAPLKDVTGIQVLEDENFECKGMIFDYSNGAQRALGDCRFGHYRVKTYCEAFMSRLEVNRTMHTAAMTGSARRWKGISSFGSPRNIRSLSATPLRAQQRHEGSGYLAALCFLGGFSSFVLINRYANAETLSSLPVYVSVLMIPKREIVIQLES
ncbi:hypothetical protein FOXB_11347 [Fusarium oxysporum f. sp. conglutinans Fo5176]|uniref:Uncharacterized protein n=1 Tax=Fusarium oxysporum (strain Fo5176) TaxID=660025 RepID=F9FY65_FUSOF|nr:hypothetical protein FOXB_11347 [Fusarium oxysporum f. sp. conglutinans Fo5176]